MPAPRYLTTYNIPPLVFTLELGNQTDGLPDTVSDYLYIKHINAKVSLILYLFVTINVAINTIVKHIGQLFSICKSACQCVSFILTGLSLADKLMVQR